MRSGTPGRSLDGLRDNGRAAKRWPAVAAGNGGTANPNHFPNFVDATRVAVGIYTIGGIRLNGTVQKYRFLGSKCAPVARLLVFEQTAW